MTRIFSFLFLTCLLISITTVSYAATQRSGRFSGEASIIDSSTLKVGLRTVSLWGIKSIQLENSLMQIQLNELLENMADAGTVSCKIVKDGFPKATARCISSKDVDFGLELINEGFAIVDKNQLDNSEFSKIYLEAQQTSREKGKGIWGRLESEKKKDMINEIVSNYVSNSTIWIVAATVILFVIFIFATAMLWIKRSLTKQKEEIEKIYFKEYLLKAKEKGVVISLIRGELEENKSKLRGFITLYTDMLDDVKTAKKEKIFEITGESLKRAPLLKRKIFDMNTNKLSFLEMTVANKLNKLYLSFAKEEEYVELNKSFSVDMVKNLIKDSLKNAQEIMQEIEKSINLLDVEYMSILDFVGKHGNPSNEKHKTKSLKNKH